MSLIENKIILNRKLTKTLRFFVYASLLFIFILIIWAYFSKVDIVVFSFGRVRPNYNVSEIRNKKGGVVKFVNYSDGQKVKSNDILYELDSKELNIELEKYNIEENKHKRELNDKKLLLKSILSDNPAPCLESDVDCHYEYMAYKVNYQRLILSERASKKVFDAHRKQDFTARLERDRFKTEYLLNANAIDKYYYETITELKRSINDIEHRLKEIECEKIATSNEIIQCVIRAPISGAIQVFYPINENEYLMKGEKILKIIPDSGEKYKMEITVQNTDIGKIKVNQIVEYKILTYNYKEYGTMNGKITKISKDSTSKGYKVTGSVNGNKIIGADGKTGTLMPGMLFESKIIVFKKRILSFLIEQLNVFHDFSFPAD